MKKKKIFECSLIPYSEDLEKNSILQTEAGNYRIDEIIVDKKGNYSYMIYEISASESKKMGVPNLDRSVEIKDYTGHLYWSNGTKYLNFGNGKFIPIFGKTKFEC
jgi:hypothetical protein